MKRICKWTVVVGVLGLFGAAAPAQATFPGANGKIAFESCEETDCGIFVINPDGSGRTQITHGTLMEEGGVHGIPFLIADSDPAWSPDGKRIAFLGQRPDAQDQTRIANADGTEDTSLGVSGGHPAWSPDGARIALNGIDGIDVINADGSGLTHLTSPDRSRFPDWGVNGRIAFTASGRVGDASEQTYSMNGDGSDLRQLTFAFGDTSGVSNYFPSWSPDGSKLAIALRHDGFQLDIYVMNSDGSGLTNITNAPDSDEEAPAWSPDGTKIVYTSEQVFGGVPQRMVVMNADGTDPQTVTEVGHNPAWQPIPITPLCTNPRGKPKKPHGHGRNCK